MAQPTAQFEANRAAMLALVDGIDEHLARNRAGGGPEYVDRHRSRGKLLARERVELLLDRDAPFLELMPFAAFHTEFAVGASLITGIGVVEGVECMIVAHEPTIRGGASNPWTFRKIFRALEISRQNRLPFINVVESGGADLPTQADLFIPGGELFRELSLLSVAKIPTLALVFGNSTAGGAYVPGMCEYTVFVRDRAKVFLGGPPLVKMATGEIADDEELGGADMHTRVSGLSDYLAEDEHDCLRIARDIVRRLNHRKLGPPPTEPADEPLHDPDELAGIVSVDVKVPFDMREVLARVLDGSRFDEFKPLFGTSMMTGWGSIHGYPVGVLANQRGIIFSAEAQKATQFIQLANKKGVSLLFVHNTTGFMVGKDYEQGGMIKHGAMLINAVTGSTVPHISLMAGASYGAGNFGMSGRAYQPRFVFGWPSNRSSVMGPQQLAGVMSIVARAAAEKRGAEYDEDRDAAMRRGVEEQIDAESLALANSGRIYDDGIIDPRDTRIVLGMALEICHGNEIAGADTYSTFRM